ncbi:hypothetical protein FQN55_000271 [Onygenales sp. PD_40]|nr:hypothetical protein FQN55_000271 [Onygenales sp. PD_40]
MGLVRESPHSAHQALLELEKGTSGPSSQLQEAAQIIGIDLSLCTIQKEDEETASAQNTQKTSAPKEEWVLRWLMKKLKAPSRQGQSSYRLDKRSWVLLRQLFFRIPAKPLAFILNENKFLAILKDSLVDLGNASSARAERPTIKEPAASESSVTVQESPVSPSSKRGQKRKRAENGVDAVPSAGSFAGSWIDAFLALLDSVKVLVILPDQITETKASINSQLKLVLRGDPQTAAAILGQTFSLAADAIIEWNKSLLESEQRLLSSLSFVLEIWKLSSERLGEGANVSNNDAFSSQCLSQALSLLSTIREYPNGSTDRTNLVQGIERTIVLHFILPIRESFFSKTSPEPANINNSPDSKRVKLVFKDVNSRWKDCNDGTNTKLIPSLFDIAIRALPRDTFRRQVHEAPWLETLFVALSTASGCPLSEDSSWNSRLKDTSVLELLLQVALDRKVNIALDTVAQYASRFSGLLDNKTQPIEWALISKLVHMGVDVFLPNSGLDAAENLLDNLVRQITSLWLCSASISAQTYETIKGGIVIPLLNGFSGARTVGAFFEIWYQQLKSLEDARLEGTNISYFSVWEDDDLSAALGPLVTNAFSENQTRDRLQAVLDAFENSSPSEQYASIVLIGAILTLRSRTDISVLQDKHLVQIFGIVTKLIAMEGELPWKWRLWRLAQCFIEKHAGPSGNISFDLNSTVLPNAVAMLQKFHKPTQPNMNVNDCLEVFEAFKLIVLVAGTVDDSKESEFLNLITPTIAAFLSQAEKSSHPAWNGRAETMASPQTLVIGYLTSILATPLAVSRLTSENRTLIFKEILTTIDRSNLDAISTLSTDILGASTLGSQLLGIWNALVSPEWLLEAPSTVYDLVNTLHNYLKEKKKGPRTLCLTSLLSIPTQLIPRHQRGMLLDLLQQNMLQEKIDPSTEHKDALTLMTRLADMPKSSAQITSDWEQLWKLSNAITTRNTGGSTALLLQGFRQLHRAVIDRVLVSSDAQRRAYLQKTFDKVSSIISKYPNANFHTMEFFMVALSLQTLYAHHEHFDGELKIETVNALRERVFNVIISDLRSLEKALKKRPEELETNTLYGILNTLEDFEDLVKKDKDVQKTIRKVEERMDTAEYDVYARSLVKRRMVSSQKASKDFENILMDALSLFQVNQLHAEQQQQLFREIRHRLSSLPEKKLVHFVHQLRTTGFASEDASHRLLLTGTAISCFGPVEDRDSEASQELSSLFTAVSDGLTTSNAIEPFTLAAESLEMLLRNQSRSITQWNIDNILGTLSVTASTSGPKIPGEYAGAIYIRICRLLGLLFGQYRQKLSGRFHLILPILQRLLRLLFSPGSRPQKSSRLVFAHPPWIEDNTILHQPTYATHFTRLLTTLCDPTVSTVQRGQRSDSGLTDNTKKVKSLAGQHLQYLVMEYAMCQLRGQLGPEMKAALMPGFYSVLDVMSKETMRGMNAAMDSSSRAVFKGLYDDYLRYGKWNHG